VIGPDWISGGAFFIRNRREPTLYWFVHKDNTIRASHEDRTKFRIASFNNQNVNEKNVLIRDDPIIINALRRPNVGQVNTTITSSRCSRLKLGINNTGKHWKFEIFINTFGVQIGDEYDVYGEVTGKKGKYVTVMNEDPQAEQDWEDEWELV
jgi:hypothetical protein